MNQAEIDKITYDMFVDVSCSASEAARQLGCTPATVDARVGRHVRRQRGVTDEQARADAGRRRELDNLVARVLGAASL